jgi:protein SCO1/2
MPDDAAGVVAARPKPTLGQILRARPWMAAPWLALLLSAPFVVLLRARRAPVPVYRQLPPFRLTDQTARPYGSDDLRGHPWVANFMFTSCPFSCPRLTRHMARVQEALRARGDATAPVRMVSFTVDPDVDTPSKLAEYAARYRVDPARWRFLTGPTPDVQRLSQEGFQLAMGAPPEGRPEGYNILHGEHVLLVDARGRIRGYYRADDEGLASVVRDAETLSLEAASQQ